LRTSFSQRITLASLTIFASTATDSGNASELASADGLPVRRSLADHPSVEGTISAILRIIAEVTKVSRIGTGGLSMESLSAVPVLKGKPTHSVGDEVHP
jgi:hypothetical protein